jgi:hypothetical protein
LLKWPTTNVERQEIHKFWQKILPKAYSAFMFGDRRATDEMPFPLLNILSLADQDKFWILYRDLHYSHVRRTPAARLRMINDFVCSEPIDADKRARVCGIFAGDEAIAVNGRRLSRLMGQCKSRLNDAFRDLAYVTTLPRPEAIQFLTTVLPGVAANDHECRQWTVRKGKALARQLTFAPKGYPELIEDEVCFPVRDK